MADPDAEDTTASDRRTLIFYDVPVTLPLVVGASALVGGVSLILGATHRVAGLEIAYFLAVAFVVGGVAAYVILGMWLLPASMIAGGLMLFSANQALLYLQGWALVIAAPYLLLGLVGVAKGAFHAFRTQNPEPGS